MTRLTTATLETATGATADVFAKVKKSVGKVPNAFATIGTHSPDGLQAIFAIDAAVTRSELSNADIETLKLVVSEISGCDYCVAAHALKGKFSGLSQDVMALILAGKPTGDARRDALIRFVQVLVETRGTLPAAELDAFRAAGYSEHQVIGVSLAIASITFGNLVNRINDTVIDFPLPAQLVPANNESSRG
ncbi:alkylhydroperoxidase [Caballeronia cordobensis]|uniref:Alkylhydroperoxidase n=1 Tax=Caballeronia cordobensis TaxID=1353886 RepID=A0A158G5S7_CABCO|nr:carboxymuconolactone decarboxylase family protein [Caballeronia cordobensis]SAL27455.1 alkylhydroperoxidase [Caballeronia cordobensis]